MAGAYSRAGYRESATVGAHEDEIVDASVGYSVRLFRKRDPCEVVYTADSDEVDVLDKGWKSDFTAAVQFTDTSSAAPAFNGSRTALTLGIRWTAQDTSRSGASGSPGNEDSSTTSPADLGPKKPVLGGP